MIHGPFAGDVDLGGAEVIMLARATDDSLGHGLGTTDLNDDGVDELLVGGPGDDRAHENAGATYLVSHPPTGTFDVADVAQATFVGALAGDGTGIAAESGNVDGVGISELLIGGPGMAGGGGLSVVYATF